MQLIESYLNEYKAADSINRMQKINFVKKVKSNVFMTKKWYATQPYTLDQRSVIIQKFKGLLSQSQILFL